MPVRKKLFISLVAVIAALVLLAGCGGGGSDSTVTIKTSSLDKEAFIAKAGHACQKLRQNMLERVLRYMQAHESKHETRADETTLLAATNRVIVLPTIRKELATIRALGAPAGDEDEIEAFVTAEQEEVETLAKQKHLVSRFELERYFVPSAKIAREYGLEACANGEATS